MNVVRENHEIDILEGTALKSVEEGGEYPGMLYEQGILDAIAWLRGDTEDNPLPDDDE